MTAIQCVDLNVATDNGAQIFNLDEIVGQGQVTNPIITLTNALSGEPIDVTEPRRLQRRLRQHPQPHPDLQRQESGRQGRVLDSDIRQKKRW